MRILALDFETGGLDPSRHGAVQLGLAVMNGDEVEHSQSWTIGPKVKKNGYHEREYGVMALSISGTKWKEILAAPPPRDTLYLVQAWLKSIEVADAPCYLPIVSHNAVFDQGFWSDLVFQAGGYDRKKSAFVPFHQLLCGAWHCTMRNAQGYTPLDDYKLDTVAKHFGLSREGDKHGALEDAILAGRVFYRLTAVAESSAEKD